MRIKEEEEKVAVIDWHFLLTLQLIQDCYFFHSVAKKKKNCDVSYSYLRVCNAKPFSLAIIRTHLLKKKQQKPCN